MIPRNRIHAPKWTGIACFIMLWNVAATAIAEVAPSESVQTSVNIAPIFELSNQVAPGWSEFVVQIQNSPSTLSEGEVHIETLGYSHRGASEGLFHASAPYRVAPAANYLLKLPVFIPSGHTVKATATTKPTMTERTWTTLGQVGAVIVDMSSTPKLRPALEGKLLPVSYGKYLSTPMGGWGSMAAPTYYTPTVYVANPKIDIESGDPILPEHGASYSCVDVVFARSEALTKLSGKSLEALSHFVLSGGTLAISISRPEDLRHATVVSFTGAALTPTTVANETLADLKWAIPADKNGGSILSPEQPQEATKGTLVSNVGGNLHASAYGASAPYGLGEVHILAFDPTQKGILEDAWVVMRMLHMTSRAYVRHATTIYTAGEAEPGSRLDNVRRILDPNENSGIFVAIALFFLCAYAIVAGPLNFSRAARKNKPIQAFVILPILSVATFFLLVLVGTISKGLSGRARHLTLIELGSGMTQGTARRWRGLFSARSSLMSISATDLSGLVTSATLPDIGLRHDSLRINHARAELTDVMAAPWETVIVREDAVATLGNGVSILPDSGSDVTIVNKSGHTLRSAILWIPSGDAKYFTTIKDGEKVSSTAGVRVDGLTGGTSWVSSVKVAATFGTVPVHTLHPEYLEGIVEDDTPGLTAAWSAIAESTGGVDWFPDAVPTMIAQLEGGEGATSDSGFRVDSDRALIRVVGLGGTP